MGYFQVRYDSRVVIYNRRGFIRLGTGLNLAADLGPVLALLLLYSGHRIFTYIIRGKYNCTYLGRTSCLEVSLVETNPVKEEV